MERFIQAVNTRLSMTGKFTPTQLNLISMAMMDEATNYRVEQINSVVAINDIFNQPGYKEFFACKIMHGLSSETVKQYKHYLDRFLVNQNKSLEDIKGTDITVYLHKRRTVDGISARSANNTRRALSSFFKWLYENEYVQKNPMKNVDPIKEPKRKQRVINEEEYEKIVTAARSSRDRAIITVLAGSGIRVGELVGMKRSDLYLDEGRFTVIGKGDKERTCFLTPRAKHNLERYLEERSDDNQLVFVSKRKPHEALSTHSIDRMLRRTGNKAGVPYLHAHMFRHFFADNAHNAGIDLLDISRLLGHAAVNTTQIYIDNNVDDLAYKHQRIR